MSRVIHEAAPNLHLLGALQDATGAEPLVHLRTVLGSAHVSAAVPPHPCAMQ